MSVTDFFIDFCVIYKRTVDTSGKTAKETFTSGLPVDCRILKRAQAAGSNSRTQLTTDFRVIIMLRKGEVVSARDQIVCEGRRYNVLEVIIAKDMRGETHRNAVCEAVE